jgi:metallo-beta-lactamase family protein
MKITFHGAAQTVTGSKHLIELENNKRILLDCGLFQGSGQETDGLNRTFGFDPKIVNYLILSHAHIDHSGLIPKLVKEGFSGKIYCTPATLDLCQIMLADSAYIQEADVKYVNKKRKAKELPLLEPIYTIEDVQNAMQLFVPIDYNEEYKINDFIKLLFTDSGHILGSAAVYLKITEGSETKKIFYTGDIGRFKSGLLRKPQSFPQPDIIICESTYGDRLHKDLDEAEQEVLDAVIETCSVKRGKLIIPAFSLGRTQEVVYALNKLNLHGLLPNVKIYVDSPLSISATEITRKHTELLSINIQNFMKDRPDPFGFDGLIYINSIEESQNLNTIKEPCVIISASGMAEAGRVKHHILHNISDSNNTILLVGYAEPQSLAGKLRSGESEVRIYGDMYTVKAEIKIADAFSAHGDYIEMIEYLKFIDPAQVEKIFLVHGNIEVQEKFKDLLKEEGFNNIYIPAPHSEYFI